MSVSDASSESYAISVMTTEEAIQWKANLANAATTLRALLWEGYTRESWRALGYDHWTACLKALAEDYGFTERRLWQLHSANRKEHQLHTGILPAQKGTEQISVSSSSVGEFSEGSLRPLSTLDPADQRAAWQQAVATAPSGKVTAAHVQETVRQFFPRPHDTRQFLRPEGHIAGSFVECDICRKTYDGASITYCPYCNHTPGERMQYLVGVEAGKKEAIAHFRAQGTHDNEWYTPSQYLTAARNVLGTIDLDPASSDHAQHAVQATAYFTAQEDGLHKEWHGRVWLNPPYVQPLIAQFVAKLVAEYRAGNVTEAILLTHNYTDTAWFHLAESVAKRLCFTKGRIRFIAADGSLAAPTQGQVFFYFGHAEEMFLQAFTPFGFIR